MRGVSAGRRVGWTAQARRMGHVQQQACAAASSQAGASRPAGPHPVKRRSDGLGNGARERARAKQHGSAGHLHGRHDRAVVAGSARAGTLCRHKSASPGAGGGDNGGGGGGSAHQSQQRDGLVGGQVAGVQAVYGCSSSQLKAQACALCLPGGGRGAAPAAAAAGPNICQRQGRGCKDHRGRH